MNAADWIILGLIVLAVVLALRRIRRMRGSGCSCGSAGCGCAGDCAACKADCARKK